MVLRLLPKDRRGFIPGEAVASVSDGAYGRDEEVERVLMEGVAYLERYGLLVEELRSYSSTGRGRTLSRQGKELAKDMTRLTEFMTSIKDPRALLHSDIRATALPLYERGEKHFDNAVSEAFRCVEIAVRTAANLPDEDGKELMNKAFGPTGSLRNSTAKASEEDGLRGLFAGAVGAFRNPPSHRRISWRDSLSALRQLILASELLHIVEDRGPARTDDES